MFLTLVNNNNNRQLLYSTVLFSAQTHCAVQNSPTFSTLSWKNIKGNLFKKVIYICMTTNSINTQVNRHNVHRTRTESFTSQKNNNYAFSILIFQLLASEAAFVKHERWH